MTHLNFFLTKLINIFVYVKLFYYFRTINVILKNMKIKITLLIGILGICFSMKISAETSQFMAGVAKVNITPTPEQQGQGTVVDSLYAQCLILEADGVRIAFISLDLGGYTNSDGLSILKQRHRLNELYFCPSHTHTARASDMQWLNNKLIELVDKAANNMFEARISGGHKPIMPLATNRLIVRSNGRAREYWFEDELIKYENPDRLMFGPIDSSIGVIRIDDINGKPRGILLNYACHPDALVAVRSIISGDYPGYAKRFVEAAFNNEVICLFVQGGAGDQGSLFKKPTDGTELKNYIDMVKRKGELLARETVSFAKELSPNLNDEQGILLTTDSLNLKNRYDDDVATIHFSTILINNRFAIATFPGEPFIKFQIDWKRDMSPHTIPFFFGYTWNGGQWPTYVPDIRKAALGGYGADFGPVRAPGSGEAVMARHLLNYYTMTGLMRTKSPTSP